jgi:hypothetical protein
MAAINTPTAPVSPGIATMPAMSSFIAAFEFDTANLTLTTHMKSGAIYQSKFFLPMNWTDLQTSQNHSKHWANNIKGKHMTVKVKSAKSPKSEIKRRKK